MASFTQFRESVVWRYDVAMPRDLFVGLVALIAIVTMRVLGERSQCNSSSGDCGDGDRDETNENHDRLLCDLFIPGREEVR